MYLLQPLLLVLCSWFVGAMGTQLLEKRPLFKIFSDFRLIRKERWDSYLGVNLFKLLVTKTIYGKLNRSKAIKPGRSRQLKEVRNEMMNAEAGHLIAFVTAQLAFVVLYALKNEELFFLLGTGLNILLNLYPVLLQQKNKSRISRIISVYGPRRPEVA